MAKHNSGESNKSDQRKQAQTNVTVAHKTVAHKLARACYHMMRHQAPFDAAKAFG
jgi:transposase